MVRKNGRSKKNMEENRRQKDGERKDVKNKAVYVDRGRHKPLSREKRVYLQTLRGLALVVSNHKRS